MITKQERIEALWRIATQRPAPYVFSDDGHTYWNGQRTPCQKVRVIVGKAPQPTWWCATLEGQEREAVEVRYGDQVFYLDNEDGSGWRKVTIYRGSPNAGHGSLPATRVVSRDAEP